MNLLPLLLFMLPWGGAAGYIRINVWTTGYCKRSTRSFPTSLQIPRKKIGFQLVLSFLPTVLASCDEADPNLPQMALHIEDGLKVALFPALAFVHFSGQRVSDRHAPLSLLSRQCRVPVKLLLQVPHNHYM